MMDSNEKNAISGGFEGQWSLNRLADFSNSCGGELDDLAITGFCVLGDPG